MFGEKSIRFTKVIRLKELITCSWRGVIPFNDAVRGIGYSYIMSFLPPEYPNNVILTVDGFNDSSAKLLPQFHMTGWQADFTGQG